MLIVQYEEYINDFYRKPREKSFGTFEGFEDWFFDQCDGGWDDKISIPDPDHNYLWKDGPSCMEVNCMWTKGYVVRVHLIRTDAGIVYSDGKHTNRQKHWNDEMKQVCRRMLEQKRNPTFDFV